MGPLTDFWLQDGVKATHQRTQGLRSSQAHALLLPVSSEDGETDMLPLHSAIQQLIEVSASDARQSQGAFSWGRGDMPLCVPCVRSGAEPSDTVTEPASCEATLPSRAPVAA